MIQQDPVMVTVVEPAVESTTVADVLIGALGLTGAMLFAALVLGGLLGALLIGVKKFRARYDLEPVPDSEALRVTPGLPLTSSSSGSLDT
ncbi:MAG TPA: hypothetical protein VE379_09810 [Vicinamibacterales bacterium]|nr:hypothetical protein [Vicinamibacterales bacterium]